MSTEKTYQKGKCAEQKALRFLQKAGLKYLGKNYHSPHGEIDLIVQEGNTVVFVEVRARSSKQYMEAVESIDQYKIKKLVYTSQHYLQKHGITDTVPCRFDVVTLTGKLQIPKIEWIKNAFEA